MKNAIIFVIALAVSNLAVAESPANIHGKYAAPFGLEWGMSKEQLAEMGVKLMPLYLGKDESDEFSGKYTTRNLPKNLSDVRVYYLDFKQALGLVKIIASLNHITSDWDGSKVKERYNQLKTAMINKYGKPRKEFDPWTGSSLYQDNNQFSWASGWGSKADGLMLLKITGGTPTAKEGMAGFINIHYESAALYVALEKEAEEKARSDEDAL